MHDVASWVQQVNVIRAELLDQFGPGKAVVAPLARIDQLLVGMTASHPESAPDEAPPKVTPRTAEVFNAILSLYRRTGLVPTIPEMCREVGINAPAGMEYQLKAMEAAGLIRRSPKPEGRHRHRPARSMVFLRSTPIPVFDSSPVAKPKAESERKLDDSAKEGAHPNGGDEKQVAREVERETIGSQARMIRNDCEIPKYCQGPGLEAIVTIRGKDIVLGDYDSKRSRSLYDILIQQYFGMTLTQKRANFTVAAMCDHYRAYARNIMCIDGVHVSLVICDELCRRHGTKKTTQLGRREFVALRKAWADNHLDGPTIERYTDAVIDLYRWAVLEDLTTGNTLDGLLLARRLETGR